jgi:hypothetical protein
MARQLHHLLETLELSNVSLRVVPFAVGLHHGLLTGPFTILRFPVNGDGRSAETPTIYVEGFTGDLYLDRPQEIERYDQSFTSLWDAALDTKGTQNILRQAAKEFAQ